MPDLHSLAERLYYTNRRTYSTTEGNVAYLDGSPLRRPITMPGAQRVTMAIIVIAAIIIGVVFLNMTVLASMRETAATQQAITDNLARQASIETIPQMTEMVVLSDKEIRKSFEKSGYSIIDVTSTKEDDEMVLYKVPSDMDSDEATALYALGLNTLTAPQATKLLNGSWSFTADRAGLTSMVVRYADFSTGDPQTAVANAIDHEGFDPTTVSESGVDESGNTYNMGVVEVDGKAYTWKVSALPLSDMYSITGVPEDSCYVGVRMTAQ